MKKHILSAIIAASIVAFPVAALSAKTPLNAYSKYGKVIDGEDMTTARSFEIDLSPNQIGGVFGLMIVWVKVTDANDSVTDLDMVCTSSPDGGSTSTSEDYTLQVCKSVTDGNCKSVNAGWDKEEDIASITSPKRWPWRVDIEGFPNAGCTLTPTGGAAADLLDVTITFAIKG